MTDRQTGNEEIHAHTVPLLFNKDPWNITVSAVGNNSLSTSSHKKSLVRRYGINLQPTAWTESETKHAATATAPAVVVLCVLFLVCVDVTATRNHCVVL